jgi:DNA-binding MarR family transcriptional regulator
MAGVAFAVEGDGVGFATESYAASALYTTLASLSGALWRIRWARAQWEILLTVRELDVGDGVSVVAAANHAQKQQAAVTRESKHLEKHGLLRRQSSETDARFVKMSLWDKACKNLSKLDSRREELDEFIFKEMSDKQLEHMVNFLVSIETRLRKAGVKLIVDF